MRNVLLFASLFCVMIAFPQSPTTHAPIPGSNWVNVRDFGALGNGGDDAPGFIAAIKAATRGRSFGGGTVYCPFTNSQYNSYSFPHGITLPGLNHAWVEIYLDCNIGIGGPIVIQGGGYYIHGHNAGGWNSMTTMSTSQIYANEGVSPAIQISTGGFRMENISVSAGRGDAIQIINSSSMVSLIEVHAGVRDSGATGSPLHIIGGFGYYIEGGGYEVTQDSTQPTILLENQTPRCSGMGIFTLERVFISNRGIQLKAPCGFINNVQVRAMLYENGKDAMVNLRGVWPGIINNIKLEDCAIADSNVEVINNGGARVFGVKIDGCPVTGGVLTTGGPMGMLTIWYPAEPAIPVIPGKFAGLPPPTVPSIAQTRNYELHFGDRIINTIPVLNLDKYDVQKGFVQQANPPN